jgi:hypothetical protein
VNSPLGSIEKLAASQEVQWTTESVYIPQKLASQCQMCRQSDSRPASLSKPPIRIPLDSRPSRGQQLLQSRLAYVTSLTSLRILAMRSTRKILMMRIMRVLALVVDVSSLPFIHACCAKAPVNECCPLQQTRYSEIKLIMQHKTATSPVIQAKSRGWHLRMGFRRI